jgi:hypothetical protein
MLTYTTLDGRVLDLSCLSESERTYFDRCYAAYQTGAEAGSFNNTYVSSRENPLLQATDGWITAAVWEHPLYQAVHDLGARLGIAQGQLAREGNADEDPLSTHGSPARR